MRHIAKEGRCFVINVNQFCKVSDFPTDYPPFTKEHHDRQPDGSQWTPDSILNHGGSCIIGPLGDFLAEPVWDKEEIIFADLKADDLVESRVDFFQPCCAHRTLTFPFRWTLMPLVAIPDQIFCQFNPSVKFVVVTMLTHFKLIDCQYSACAECRLPASVEF